MYTRTYYSEYISLNFLSFNTIKKLIIVINIIIYTLNYIKVQLNSFIFQSNPNIEFSTQYTFYDFNYFKKHFYVDDSIIYLIHILCTHKLVCNYNC